MSAEAQSPERGGAVTAELLKCLNIRIMPGATSRLEGIDNHKKLV